MVNIPVNLKFERLFMMVLLLVAAGCQSPTKSTGINGDQLQEISARPYTRWWWFASEIKKEDIRNQLDWLKEKHFGGVEIAFIYPVNRDPDAPRVEWLSPEWTDLVTYAKSYCDSIGLGCDFTFGTLWPFGGTFVNDSDRTQVWGDTVFRQPLRLSWTHPDTGNVIDHLDMEAFERYAAVMGPALEPALHGSNSALFCDSWEVETRYIWTTGFGDRFRETYGYDIEPFMQNIYGPDRAGPRYDYMKLVADYVLNNFYLPFRDHCHAVNAYARVQCAGSPTDILTAYAAMDIPETEAMLYNPNYSRIVASAAALAGRPLVSAEAFTCLYGWPAEHIREEKITDLKLLADALFANGTNHIIWHGTPFNPVGVDTIFFYASVHVGERGSLEKDLIGFNHYLEQVATVMREGRAYTDIAVYLPLEDAWIAGEYPPEKQLPWAWGAYEMRYLEFAGELAGYQPMWVNADFLSEAVVKDGVMHLGEHSFGGLYVDVEHLDPEALWIICDLASAGLPVCLKKIPKQAGHVKDEQFPILLGKLVSLDNVSEDLDALAFPPPLLTGDTIPEFWCRETKDHLLLFFSHPLARDLAYPLAYGFASEDTVREVEVEIRHGGTQSRITLTFEPFQSLLLTADPLGQVDFIDIRYSPDD